VIKQQSSLQEHSVTPTLFDSRRAPNKMKLNQALYFLLTFVTTIHALALPTSFESLAESSKELFKRKGGGGGGGKGGGGGSSSSSSSSSRGGSSSSSSSSSGLTSSSSNRGGATSAGSGVRPSYGGGAYYGGGARQPYNSGGRSPGGINPVFLGVGALAFFPGIWLYGAYMYPYGHPYTYHNTTSNRNETHPVQCYCGEYQECGCDNNTDSSYLNSVANNNTVSRVVNVNGTDTLVVNGTLPNGTTAAGGTDSAAGSLRQGLLEMSGWWVVVAGVAYTMWFM
jgi:hypothetical protein